MYRVVENPTHQKMLMLISAFAIFMDSLDSSIVNVAMPVIAAEYGIDISAGSWIVMAYLLIMAGFILAFGKVADNGKIREVFSIGFFIFAAGSLLSALAPSLGIMIAARGLQGLGASRIAAAAPLLVTRFLPEGKRGLGMGVIATTGGIASIVASVRDISNNKTRIEQLADLFNRMELSPIHLDDVIADFLAE